MAGYSRPAERFAARIAFMLCDSEQGASTISVAPWQLDREFHLILSERFYQITLVGLDELGLRKPKDEYRTAYNRDQFEDAEIGAGLWLKWVLDGPRQMHSSKCVHEAHSLLLHFAERGEGWPDVGLQRSKATPTQGGTVPDVAYVTQRTLETVLAKRGNRETNHKSRREKGPLWLKIGSGSCEVPDSLSLWNAICGAPERCAVLKDDKREKFIFQLARAVNTANRQWDALRRLGLSPPSWISSDAWEEVEKLDTLSVSQALKALKLVSDATQRAEIAGRQTPSQQDFRAAWDHRAILQRMSFDAFSKSRAGQAIMSADSRMKFSEVYEPSDTTESDVPYFSSEEDMEEVFELLVSSGSFDDADQAILTCVFHQHDLTELQRSNKSVKLKYRKPSDLSAALEGLQDRVLEFIEQLKTKC